MLKNVFNIIAILLSIIAISVFCFTEYFISIIAYYKNADSNFVIYGYPKRILWANELEWYAIITLITLILVVLFSNYKLRKSIVNKKLTKYFIFFIYILTVLITIHNHEPWTDEAHAWLLAKEFTFSNFFTLTQYEIMPPLWLIILIPIAKLGLTYAVMNYLNGIIVIIGMGFFFLRSHLCFKIRTLILFSYPFLFEYPIIARTYGIALLLLFIISSVYNYRLRRPLLFSFLLGMLSMTNVFMIFPALLLGIYFIAEIVINQLSKIKIITNALFFFISFFISVYSVMIPKDSIYSGYFVHSTIENILCFLTSYYIHMPNIATINIVILIPFSIIGLSIFVFIVSRINLLFFKLFLILSFLWFFYIISFRYGGDLRHYLLFFVIIISTLWIAKQNGALNFKINNFVFTILMTVSAYFGLHSVYNDIKYDFCGSKRFANYINKNNIQKDKFYCIGGQVICAVMPYMPQTKFVFLSDLKEHSYIKRNYEWTRNKNEYYNLQTILKKDDLIISNVLLDSTKYLVKLKYHSNKMVFERGSYFWLYQKL
ncbi:MAG: hypothetical protein A2X12_05095 [Bacteroidetes bacterium GWE2_29_8]|nr:MAG: hypothetical protein A2X12_05095 [Bacteroidetes bacterium GWE2_29_8]